MSSRRLGGAIRLGLPLVSALVLASCSESEPGGPEARRLEPSEGPNNRATPVVIHGRFSPFVQVDYNNQTHSIISTAFRAWLGSHALPQVSFLDGTRLTAVVPAGLPGGVHDLVVVDPRGRRGELPAGFTVQVVGLDASPEGALDRGPDLPRPDAATDGPSPDLTVDLGVDIQPTPDVAPGATVSTVAGTGQAGFKDGAAATAQFSLPRGLALNGSTVYVSDYGNHRIRAIGSGAVVTVAGSGLQGLANGAAASAKFNHPAGIAVRANGDVLVADSANDVIRLVQAGQVSTLAGSAVRGFQDGVAASAQFNFPQGVAEDAGVIYVADTENHRIRRIQAGLVSTLAGTGTKGFLDGPTGSAQFSSPTGIVVSGGTIYVADSGNNRVRSIAGGVVNTVAGSGAAGSADGPAPAAQLWNPTAVVVSGSKIYIADQSNHRVRLLEQGVVSTVAGDYAGFQDGPIASVLFDYPGGLALAAGGAQLYVADQSNQRIRLITF